MYTGQTKKYSLDALLQEARGTYRHSLLNSKDKGIFPLSRLQLWVIKANRFCYELIFRTESTTMSLRSTLNYTNLQMLRLSLQPFNKICHFHSTSSILR